VSDSPEELLDRMRRSGAGSKGIAAQQEPKAGADTPNEPDALIASLGQEPTTPEPPQYRNTATPQAGKREAAALVKYTLYLRPDQIKWLRRRKAEHEVHIYELGQEAMDEYIERHSD
jgi:hypothetical protein